MMENQQMAEEVERVTDPAAPDPGPETTKNKRAKDQNKRSKESSSWACRRCRPSGQNARSALGSQGITP